MRVRLTKQLGQHAKGSEHDVSDATGRRLIRKGDAERADGRKPRRTRAQLEAGGGARPSGPRETTNTTGEDEPLTDPK